jgi:four helix bundle protein
MEDRRQKRVVSFEDLDVFQRAYRLSLDVHRKSLEMPRIEQHALGDQVRRASKSICSNIAEGYGRQKQSKAEFKRFVWMAIGSSDEMRVWARYALDLGYIDEQTWRNWRDEYQIISKQLQVLAAGS